MSVGSPASPKVDERFESHGGFALHQEVFVNHPTESWIRGVVTEIKAVSKKGGFAEVCFGVTPAIDPVLLPSLSSAAPLFPLRESDIHQIVSDSSSSASNHDDSEANEIAGDTVHDLLQLSYLHDSTLLEQVRKRYFRNLIYTHIGPIVLALNPYDFTLKHYVDSNLPKYIEEGDAVVSRSSKNLPHAWTTAHYSYWLMCTDKKNQSVIVSGESGAGKTETAKIVVKYLGKVSTALCDDSMRAAAEQVTVRVNLTSPILEAFGNAKTRMNDNSSRFGKFMKVHFERFSGGAVMTGAAIEVYLLEKSRIVTHGQGERSYHCFYQLLAEGGKTTKDADNHKKVLKERVGLSGAKELPSLNIGGAIEIPGVDDAADFQEVFSAMRAVGLSDVEEQGVWDVVGGILHLLRVQFVAATEDECAVDTATSGKHTALISKLLQIDTDKLATELTTTTNVTRGEKIVKKLRKAFACDLRDALSKFLYESLFLWLVAKINSLIRPPEGSSLSGNSWIGLLDIFGFENFAHGNSFEQMCINLANETLQNHYNSIIFTRDMEECRAEGINTESVTFYDNQPCLDLICGVNFSKCGPGGAAQNTNKFSIMSLLDESASLATGTDLTLCSKIVEQYGGKSDGSGCHPNFSKPKLQNNAFCIIHYAGEVKYTIDGFRAKNADTLKESLKDMCRESQSKFMTQLVGADPSSPTTSGPSSKKSSVGSFFKNQLVSLMTEINGTHPHWIRCVKPHSAKKPKMFHGTEVMTQLRSAGVLETVRIRQQSYSIRLMFEEFVERHKNILRAQPSGTAMRIVSDSIPAAYLPDKSAHSRSLLATFKIDPSDLPAACAEILRRSGILKHELAQVGKTKVFLRTGAFHVLSQVMRIVKSSLVHSIQAYARGYSSGRVVRCRQLNNNVRLITAFLLLRPSQHVMRLKELREREKELLTKFRKLMILQGDESSVRIQFEAEREAFMTSLEESRQDDLVAIRRAWEQKQIELARQRREALLLLEESRRDSIATSEGAVRSTLAQLLQIDSDEESNRNEIELDEATIRASALRKRGDEVREALKDFRLATLQKAIDATADIENTQRKAIELDEQKEFQIFEPFVELSSQEVKARQAILQREQAKYDEFPTVAAKQLEDIKRNWYQRKDSINRFACLVLQHAERDARVALEEEMRQELILLLEDVNESEAWALDCQYAREAQDERARLAVVIKERELRQAEEQYKFDELRKGAQEIWAKAEYERNLQKSIDDTEAMILELKTKQAALTREFMEDCRRREISALPISSTRPGKANSASAVGVLKNAERLRQLQLQISVKVRESEAHLAELRFEQSTPKPPGVHTLVTGGSRATPQNIQNSSQASQMRMEHFRASLSPPRKANSPDMTERQAKRSASPLNTASTLRQTAVHHAGSTDLLQRLSVIKTSASSSNYTKSATWSRGDTELVPEYTNTQEQIRKLERFRQAKSKRQNERLAKLEETPSSEGPLLAAAKRSASLSLSPKELAAVEERMFLDPPSEELSHFRATVYCSPKVHCGVSVHWPPVPKAQQIFPRQCKNPFSDSWRPVRPPMGGDPQSLYSYLPDGSLVRIPTQETAMDLDVEAELIDMDATQLDTDGQQSESPSIRGHSLL